MNNRDAVVTLLESSTSESSATTPENKGQYLSRCRNRVGNNDEPTDAGDTWVLVAGVF